MPKYFIKKVNYHYDDETFSPSFGEVSYFHVPGDKQAVERKLLELERKQYSTAFGLEEFDQVLRPKTGEGDAEKLLAKLNAFSLEQFGYVFAENLWEGIQGTPWRMPADATLEQTAAFRELSGIHFYEMVEAVTDVPPLLGIYLTGNWTKTQGWQEYRGVKYTGSSSDSGIPNREEKNVPIAFSGKQGALRGQQYGAFNFSVDFDATPEEVSGQPALLRALIDGTNDLSLDPGTGKIVLAKYAYGIDWIAINELLKDKIFELRELPSEVVVAANGYLSDPY
ncbi:MAG: hypothetical protein AAFN92_16020 [Bacteroidota bacterium]